MAKLEIRHPFNEEIGEVAHSFAVLIKPMIATIDRFGLRRVSP